MRKTLHMVSLGCPKNRVDSEVMLAALVRDGYTVVAQPEEASLILVNTCGFIRSAVEEAIDEILHLAASKEDDPEKLLVVTGCMVQRYGSELQEELPEVDLFVGLDDFAGIDRLVRQLPRSTSKMVHQPGLSTYLMSSSVPRLLTTPFFRSYLKITEGCDNRCSYCMIPSIRGPLRSRPIADLVAEARSLAEAGVKELTLVAQDLTAYGMDLPGGGGLGDLLAALLDRTALPWIRLMYLYPTRVSSELLEQMAAHPRLLPYLDIPFQHVSDPVLKRMNRHYGVDSLDDLVGRIRSHLPSCAIRTTLLVGFPGETDEDVRLLTDRLLDWQLDHVGVFQYEDEDGSVAALLPGKVGDEEKSERYRRVMETQAAISGQRQQRFVDRIEPVLVEGVSEESDLLLEGRTRFQAPEIDGCVYITAGQVTPGDIVSVRITEAHTYDLVGEVVNGTESR